MAETAYLKSGAIKTAKFVLLVLGRVRKKKERKKESKKLLFLLFSSHRVFNEIVDVHQSELFTCSVGTGAMSLSSSTVIAAPPLSSLSSSLLSSSFLP